jgi:hypothetical protein
MAVVVFVGVAVLPSWLAGRFGCFGAQLGGFAEEDEDERAELMTSEPIHLLYNGQEGKVLGKTVWRFARGFTIQTYYKLAAAVIEAMNVRCRNDTPGRKPSSQEEDLLKNPLT